MKQRVVNWTLFFLILNIFLSFVVRAQRYDDEDRPRRRRRMSERRRDRDDFDGLRDPRGTDAVDTYLSLARRHRPTHRRMNPTSNYGLPGESSTGEYNSAGFGPSDSHYGSGKLTYSNWRNKIDEFANTRPF